MYLRPEDRARPNRMALRIAVVGGVAVALFGILFFRLWDLQILEGAENLAQAKNNRTRSTKVVAPRGEILYNNGEVLVDNRTSLALQVDTSKLPEETAAKNAELKEIGELVHMKLPQVLKVMKEEQEVVAAGAPLTIRQGVGYDLIYYMEEHKGKFPGVTVEKVFVRNYPQEDQAAQILGHVNEVSEEEITEPGPYKGTEPGEVVGQEGLELTYDKYLRGTPGTTRYQVNAMGEPTPGGRLTSTPPTPGDSLKLSLNQAVQEAGESALAQRGLPGAFVSMNIHTGEILGMGSAPTYDPSVWVNLSQKHYEELASEENGDALFNRATSSAYPTGSTYKIITALAGLENGVFTPSTVVDDTGEIEVGGQTFENSEGAINGPITLVPALEKSSDVFFYTQGYKMWKTDYLQEWSAKMGIGRPTGIDLPLGEGAEGLVPSKKWTEEEEANGNEYIEPWGPGQNIQLAVGQGYLQTDPLEMAIAYSALGNGGTIVTPHLGKEVQDAAGRVLREIDPGPRRHVKINPEYRRLIMEGLHDVTSGPGGTATEVFKGFPIPVAGKTGTAERGIEHGNQSWFISLAPYPNPNVVTVVTIEEGGFGAESAAPANREILEALYGGKLKNESEKETKAEEKEFEAAYGGESETGESTEGAGYEETEASEYEGEFGELAEGETGEGEGVAGEEAFGEEATVEETPVETEGGGIG
ncbi:MAG TPA: penicillin-binding protein 2 [Solirubrobacterales bacterium]|nr:penicillin-binding protein 2 [Solirubrobacterales bacterium]